MVSVDKIRKIKDLIEKSSNIVVFTGAGISVPSGIPDFRSSNGLYNQKTKLNISPEEIISHSFFCRNTLKFYEFYKEKMVYENATYNEAHKFFANLEKLDKKITIITQNIDGLHTLAGSTNVLELHGTIHKNHCTKCHKFYSLNEILKSRDIPGCECGGIIKPDVVLYEESLDYNTLTKSIREIANADLIIVVGTSLVVEPAASLLHYYKGNNLVIINKDTTPYDRYASTCINDDIISVVKELNPIIYR